MADSIPIGLELDGKVLQLVPPNATNEQQIAALNNVISTLNNVNKDIVASGIVWIDSDGSYNTTTTIAHNLGYKPRIFGYLNDVILTIGDVVHSDVDIPLPGFASVGVDGDEVAFFIYIYMFVDAQNAYIQTINASQTPFQLPVKYFLTREASNSASDT